MKIIMQTTTGGPDVLHLKERPNPEPAAGEVLVRVSAAGVNPVDVAVRTGAFPLLGVPPFAVGWDISGTVEALGAGVNSFAVGDRVFGMPRFPGQAAAYATHVTAPAEQVARVPQGIDMIDAGALPLAGLTAWQALVRHGHLQAGQRVLIHGGAGGVGHLAVQIALALGADVTATASAGKIAAVRSLGANSVLDYARDPVGAGYDFVLDPQSGVQAEASVAATRDGGHVVVLLPPSDAATKTAAARSIALTPMSVTPDAEGLRALADLSVTGKLKVLIGGRFPLSEAGAAHTFLATKPIGKVVLIP